MDAALHRGDTQPEQLGDLGVGESLQVAQQEDVAVFGGELFELACLDLRST